MSRGRGRDGGSFELLTTSSGLMQNVLPLTPGNPLRNVTGLARQISLPGEHAPLRFPSFPALERTAVMGFNTPVTIETITTAPTAVTVFRQAAFPVWADQTTSPFWAVDYATNSIEPGTSGLSTESVTATFRPNVTGWTGTPRAAANSPGFSGTAIPTGVNYAIMGRDANLYGAEFTYLPNGCDLHAVISSSSNTGTTIETTLVLEEWLAPGQSSTAHIFNTLGITVGQRGQSFQLLTADANNGRWFRPISMAVEYPTSSLMSSTFNVTLWVTNQATGNVSYANSSSSAGTVGVTFATNSRCHVPLSYPAEFRNSILPWYATRVTAAAFLGTNVTQILNKSGTVLGGRVSPAVVPAWKCDYNTVNNLHPAEKAYLPLETGVYTYCPPSTDLVFFTDYTLNTSNAAVAAAPIFSLSNDSMYNRMFLSTPSAVAAIAGTVTWHIEFRTSSALFQIGLSAMTLESLHQAQLVLAENGFFFENPEHERLLNKVIASAKKYAPGIVSAINPTFGRMLQSMSDMRRDIKPKQGPGKPSATSAKGSGVVQAPKKGKGPKPKPRGKKGK